MVNTPDDSLQLGPFKDFPIPRGKSPEADLIRQAIEEAKSALAWREVDLGNGAVGFEYNGPNCVVKYVPDNQRPKAMWSDNFVHVLIEGNNGVTYRQKTGGSYTIAHEGVSVPFKVIDEGFLS